MIRLFKQRKEFVSFIVGATFLFGLYVGIPVFFIPGNTLSFYFSTEPWWGFLLLVVLALEISFIITRRIFVALRKKATTRKGFLADSAAVFVSILPSVLACPILAVTLFSFFLPITTIWSLVGYQWHMVTGATILMTGVVFHKINKEKRTDMVKRCYQ